jgi:two-component system response regulator AlgR
MFKVLVVDDEALARSRLKTLLGDCVLPQPSGVQETESADQALALLATEPFDLCLLDIHMPGTDGMAMAGRIRALPSPPAVVFVTAHAEHALQAFENDAVDYLTKPVRRDRLQVALDKAVRSRHARQAAAEEAGFLLIHDRGRAERVPLQEILYLKAELKYVTVRTTSRSHIYDGSLQDLELKLGPGWLRVHRNALVPRRGIRALEKTHDTAEGEVWVIRLRGVDEPVVVSRRQLPAVREALAGAC